MRKEHGFTLIELLIVLAILGILVGIVAMSVGDLTDTAKSTGMEAELDTVQTAIDTFNTQDVIVNNTPPIPTREVAARIWITDTDAPFSKYLKAQGEAYTKYVYTWTLDIDNHLIVANPTLIAPTPTP